MSQHSRFNILEKKVWSVYCTSQAHPPGREGQVAGGKKGQRDYQSHQDSNEGSKGDSPKGYLDPATNIRIKEAGRTDTTHPPWAGTESLQPSHLWWLGHAVPCFGNPRNGTRKNALEWSNMAAQERAVGSIFQKRQEEENVGTLVYNEGGIQRAQWKCLEEREAQGIGLRLLEELVKSFGNGRWGVELCQV